MGEIRYVPEGQEFDEEVKSGAGKAKRLMGNTSLSKQALVVTGRSDYGFRDKKQRDAFAELEGRAIGATDEAKMWKAWILFKIGEAKGFNKRFLAVSMDELIRRIEGKSSKVEETRVMWFRENRNKVLNPKSAKAISDETGVKAGIEEMERRANGSKAK